MVSPREWPAPEGGYKVVSICDIFHVLNSKKKFNAIDLSFNGSFPYVVRTSNNNGIKGYVDLDESFLNEGKTISFGQDTATINYQPKPYFTGDKIKVLKLKNGTLNKASALYLVTLLRKSFNSFSWGVTSFSDNAINNVKIIIPVTNTGELNFDYMESRVRELEAYLSEAGLDDCELTNEEKVALTKYKSDNISYDSFSIGSLFEIYKGKRLTKENMIPGEIPFIGATASNNGRTNTISNHTHLHPANVITVTYNGSVGEAFYQTSQFWASDDVNVLRFKDNLNENLALYFLAPLRKKGKGCAFL